MSPQEPAWERRRLRAPQYDGEVLAIPPLTEMPAAVIANRRLIDSWDVQVLGKSLRELRRLAREEVLTAAARFTSRLDEQAVNSHDSSPTFAARLEKPLIVSGHQPELFHPGVWSKNFVLDRVARATDGIGLHLIVDNDTITSTRVAIPVGSREHPRVEQIPFDADSGAITWEEAALRDETLFRTFPDRVAAALECWPIQPMLREIWPVAVRWLSGLGAHPRPRLADLLTVVRREAERSFGLENLELPMSQLCETESFAWFVCSLLSDPKRTHSIYNKVVADYRRVNRVRNRQHPVPDLIRQPMSFACHGSVSRDETNLTADTAVAPGSDDWMELPFWIWRAGDLRRGRLFVRATSDELQLANNETFVASLPRPDARTAESVVVQLRAFSSMGWKIRPRALTTTLFARVFLADAFLHGIGGAKYDEMTDRLISRLFGIDPPSYLIATATHRLPLDRWNVTPSDVAALKHRLWDFEHSPERYVPAMSPLPPGEGGRRPGEGRAAIDSPVRNRIVTGSASALIAPSEDRFPHPSPLPEGEGTAPLHSEFAELLTEKHRLITEQHTQDALDRRDPRRGTHAANNHRRRRFREISRRLAAFAAEARSAIAAELETTQIHLAANAVLQSREFSFCLFSMDQLSMLAQTTIQKS